VTVEVLDATLFSFLIIIHLFPFFIKETTVRVFNEMTLEAVVCMVIPLTVI